MTEWNPNWLNAPTSQDSAGDFAPPTDEQVRVGSLLYDNDKAPTLGPAGPTDFYGHSALATALDQQLRQMWQEQGTSVDDQRQIRDTFSTIADETNLPEAFIVKLADGYLGQLRADAKPVGDADAAAREQALAQRTAAQTIAARVMLRDRYGSEKEADALIQRTLKFVQAHPALHQVMSHGGIGSDPAIVEELVSFVFSSGFR